MFSTLGVYGTMHKNLLNFTDGTEQCDVFTVLTTVVPLFILDFHNIFSREMKNKNIRYTNQSPKKMSLEDKISLEKNKMEIPGEIVYDTF